MTAKILIIDDVKSNIDFLEVKLASSYYDVNHAMDGHSGIQMVKEWHPDLILLDVMMPVLDGFQVCKMLKCDHASMHIPIIMVTALNDRQSRIKGLLQGADDFLSKPVDDFALLVRIKSLLRLKMITDELRLRYDAISQLDGELARKLGSIANHDIGTAKVLVIEDDIVQAGQIRTKLREKNLEVLICKKVESSFEVMRESLPDLVIIDLQLLGLEGLKICSQLRRESCNRHTPFIMIVDEDQEDSQELLERGIELGINDYISAPLDGSELLARVLSQLKYKSYHEILKTQMQDDVMMSILDPLTKCYNRRYFDIHLDNKIKDHADREVNACLAIIDLDNFKSVNDQYGHQDGDKVIKAVVDVVRNNIRDSDLLARYGGEEFAIVIQSGEEDAYKVCEEVRKKIENNQIELSSDVINRTVSIGLSGIRVRDTRIDLIKRADEALYEAKRNGKNQVILSK